MIRKEEALERRCIGIGGGLLAFTGMDGRVYPIQNQDSTPIIDEVLLYNTI